MPSTYLAAIDIGTTSVKVGFFDISGDLISLSTREYSLLTPDTNRVELSVEVYWDALAGGVREGLSAGEIDPKQVAALSLSSQGETLVCVDPTGDALSNAIVWLDARAESESAHLEKSFDMESIYRTTGYPEMSPLWPAAKILWIRENEPDTFRKTAKFLILKDYIIFRLTGVYATDLSESSSTLYLDTERGDWWDDMLDEIGIHKDLLPEIRGSSEVVGNLTSDAATALGLTDQTIVTTGAMDQIAAAVGAGNVEPGTITESTGTALAVIATVGEPTFDDKRRIPCSAHYKPGLFALMPYAETSGIVLKWFRETFPSHPDRLDEYAELMKLASGVAPGAEGLRALPHFTGTASPDFNPAARGAFTGISFHHDRSHFVRALVESVAFLLRENVDLLRDLSIPINSVRSLGGAANSDLWCQIKADVLGTPVEVPVCSEAASLGAAIFAGVGAGIYPNVEDAAERIVAIERRFEPRGESISTYNDLYNEYRSIYTRLYG